MAGETYWRCTRCGVAFRLVGEPAGCANDMCASSSFEPVVVLPVAEYERMRGIEARLRESLRVCGGWLERVEWEDYMDGDDPGNDDLNALHTGEPLPDETLRSLGRSAVLREEKP